MLKGKKIIIACALIALIGAGYYFLPFSDSNTDSVDQEQLSQLEDVKTELQDGLKKAGVDKVTNYVINRAESMWSKDPFSGTTSETNPEKASTDTGLETDKPMERIHPVFIYSGYLEVADKRFAIINGFEYEANEELEVKGYFVNSIEQNWVIIEDRKTQEQLTIYFGNP